MNTNNTPDAVRLTEAAARWRALAADEIKAVESGIQQCRTVAEARADLYERTAQALEIQRDTGIAVCVCCHKCLSDHPYG